MTTEGSGQDYAILDNRKVLLYTLDSMSSLLKKLSEKKKQLDKLRPLPKDIIRNLEQWLRAELTYSSNAIEGNTLTRLETAEVLERKTAAVISGRPLKDQLEAINHAKAIDFIKDLAKQKKSHQFIAEDDIKTIQRIILTGIDDKWAGKYRQTEVFIKGVNVEFPDCRKVPYLMAKFTQWLEAQQNKHPVRVAANAHFKFVSIHPFIDGNGRTARLLMNLVLIINSYPVAVIRNEDRIQYLEAVNIGQTKNDLSLFYQIIEEAVDRSLDAYLNVAKGKSPLPSLTINIKQAKKTKGKLLKIGELAKLADETVPTIRYWTKEGILEAADYTKGGYQLYDQSMRGRVKKIRKLQKEKRLSIVEIKKDLCSATRNLGGENL